MYKMYSYIVGYRFCHRCVGNLFTVKKTKYISLSHDRKVEPGSIMVCFYSLSKDDQFSIFSKYVFFTVKLLQIMIVCIFCNAEFHVVTQNVTAGNVIETVEIHHLI